MVISDFYQDPVLVIKTIEPLRYRGNELILFHVLDPAELAPSFRKPMLLVDMENEDSMDVTPEYAHTEYRAKIESHIQALKTGAARAGMEYFMLDTSRPLDQALREFLVLREGRM